MLERGVCKRSHVTTFRYSLWLLEANYSPSYPTLGPVSSSLTPARVSTPHGLRLLSLLSPLHILDHVIESSVKNDRTTNHWSWHLQGMLGWQLMWIVGKGHRLIPGC